jgi:hypothetical protein
VAGSGSAVSFSVRVPEIGQAGDELGVWQAADGAAPDAAEAFGLAAPSRYPPQTLLWQVELPSDLSAARATLRRQEARLQAAELALPAAAAGLEQMVAAQRQAASFGFGAGRPAREPRAPGAPAGWLVGPRDELAAWIEDAQEQSFGAFDVLPAGARAASDAAAAFFEKVQRSLLFAAIVETRTDAVLQAVTVLSWDGEIRNACSEDLAAACAAEHGRVLNHVVRTRAAWLSLALLIASRSLLLAALFPTNPLLAIPAAYRFFRQALANLETIQEA